MSSEFDVIDKIVEEVIEINKLKNHDFAISVLTQKIFQVLADCEISRQLLDNGLEGEICEMHEKIIANSDRQYKMLRASIKILENTDEKHSE